LSRHNVGRILDGMKHFVRAVLLLAMVIAIASLVAGIVSGTTGPIEKGVMLVAGAALVAVIPAVRRIGTA
jgi:hypothetical protein